ncbi:MAG: hypothetical protein AMS17_17720 [Spirochaetes bacterium DG_61]|jgi:hypothetical protein|nr:MAG: hypothetical protein AMS17_17720 [Spirochaetes bacterium DG_61]
MKAYRVFSFILAVVFAIVGLTFLVIPERVIVLFNDLSSSFGMATVPAVGFNFYLILAVAYMYLVTILAVFMFRYPKNTVYPLLLCHGKIASAALSILLFALHKPFLLYLGNGIVDGGIGIVVLIIYLHKKRAG